MNYLSLAYLVELFMLHFFLCLFVFCVFFNNAKNERSCAAKKRRNILKQEKTKVKKKNLLTKT